MTSKSEIQNRQGTIENTERGKSTFPKEQIEIADFIRTEQNDDHTQIMGKIQFHSSFKLDF